MALLPDFSQIAPSSQFTPTAINTYFTNIIALLGSTSSPATFSDANVANGAALNPAKISGTAAVLSGVGSQTFSKTSIFPENILQASIGTGATTTIFVGGVLASVTVPVTSSNASTLMSYTLPANSLTTTGRGIRIRAWGTKAADGAAATVQLQIDGASVISKQLTTTAAGVDSWEFESVIERTGLNTQAHHSDVWHSCGTTGVGTMGGADGPLVATQTTCGTLALTDAGAHVIRIQATVATTTSTVQLGMTVETI